MRLFQPLGLCLSAIPGTEAGTTTSLHLIISFVLKVKSSQNPGGKKKQRGTLVLLSAMVSAPEFCGGSKSIPHHHSKTVALGNVFCAYVSPLYRAAERGVKVAPSGSKYFWILIEGFSRLGSCEKQHTYCPSPPNLNGAPKPQGCGSPLGRGDSSETFRVGFCLSIFVTGDRLSYLYSKSPWPQGYSSSIFCSLRPLLCIQPTHHNLWVLTVQFQHLLLIDSVS